MFNQEDFLKLSNWITNNCEALLHELHDNSSSLRNRSFQFKMLNSLIDAKVCNCDNDWTKFITAMDRRYTAKETFSFERFNTLGTLEEKVLYFLFCINTLSANDKVVILDGLLMYAVQEQNIPIATLLYMNVKEKDKFKNSYLELLKMEQNTDGSIGILNPIKDCNIPEIQSKNWILYNSLFVYIILPLTDSRFKRRYICY